MNYYLQMAKEAEECCISCKLLYSVRTGDESQTSLRCVVVDRLRYDSSLQICYVRVNRTWSHELAHASEAKNNNWESIISVMQ